MTIFEENEKLKDQMVSSLSAWEAKSKFFSGGVPIIPESFLETTVRWEKDAEEILITNAIKMVLDFKESMDDRCFVTEVQYEVEYGHPQIIWAIFKDDEDIFEGKL
jgi:hypothetical protein